MKDALRRYGQQLHGIPDFEAGPLVDSRIWLRIVAIFAALLTAALYFGAGHQALFLAINTLGRPIPGPVLQTITFAGDTQFALVFMLLLAKRYPRMLWTAIVASLIALLLCNGTKAFAAVHRPAATLLEGSFRIVGPSLRNGSFPSGHTTTAFVVAAVIIAYVGDWRLRLLALTAAVIIGLSRVMVGAHWPVDVAAGAAAGTASVMLALPLAEASGWGRKTGVHLAVVILLSLTAAVLLFLHLPYPAAAPAARLLAVSALALTAWRYGVAPARRARPAVAAD